MLMMLVFLIEKDPLRNSSAQTSKGVFELVRSEGEKMSKA